MYERGRSYGKPVTIWEITLYGEPLKFEADLAGKRILVTGHTGFTGSWLCTWLRLLECELYGYALPPETTPNMFEATGLHESVQSVYADLAELNAIKRCVENFQPDLIMHLAAQPLVRKSYRDPVQTFVTNTLGTAHVLEAARHCSSVKAVLCITTDKVYQNREWQWPYRENDALGGKDPYSASKAAAEIVIQSYTNSFFQDQESSPAIASVRGGNIIGGGDWSEDRLVPDFVRAVVTNDKLTLRYPEATRPWQHVLALVHGYLLISSKLLTEPAITAGAWNLGPGQEEHHSVRHVLELLGSHWQSPDLEFMDNPLPEAGKLALDSTRAKNLLGWIPPWNLEQVVAATAQWYQSYYRDAESAQETTLQQIERWREDIRS